MLNILSISIFMKCIFYVVIDDFQWEIKISYRYWKKSSTKVIDPGFGLVALDELLNDVTITKVS